MAQKLVHKRTNQALKVPTGATLDYGEIAVNYNVESPFLSIKNSDNTYSKFSSDDIIVAGMVEYVSGELKLKSDTGHTHDDRYYTETEVDAKIKAVNDTIAKHYGFSNVKVGTTTLVADSITDTVEFKTGDNIVLSAAEIDGVDTVTVGVKSGVFAPISHSHNYAGSSSAGGAATSANKLNTDAGNANTPVYFSSGVPVSVSASGTANNLISALSLGDAAPTDKTWYITSISNGTGTTFYKRPHSLLYDYLKGKFDSVYQPKGSYAAASHNHDASAITAGTLPVNRGGSGANTFTAGAALIGNGTAAFATRSITNMTTLGFIDYDTNLMTTNTLAYWNGAYDSSGHSNLAYCKHGAFGTIVTKNAGDYITSGATVAAANKLAAEKTLWGQKFDGTANVTGAISSTGNITPSASATYELGTSSNKYKNVNVSNNVNVGGSSISYNATTGCLEIIC